jgi:hypothetical protein
MAGVTADEGAKVMADLVYVGSNVDRGASLQIGLFTNSVSIGTLKGYLLSQITEPTGGGYARKTLANASWTRAVGLSTYALQSFVATAGGFTGSIYGYFIATTGTTPRLLVVEIDPAGPITVAAGDHYDVTPSILTS